SGTAGNHSKANPAIGSEPGGGRDHSQHARKNGSHAATDGRLCTNAEPGALRARGESPGRYQSVAGARDPDQFDRPAERSTSKSGKPAQAAAIEIKAT